MNNTVIMKKLKVIKIGGNIIDNPTELNSFLKSFAKIKGLKILVHGGGKLATQIAEKMNVSVQMTDGKRVTSKEMLAIVTMVYAGKINKNIVAKLQYYNCNSLGFSGADGNAITAIKRPVNKINYGFVGDIVKVDTYVPSLLLQKNITPVFCAITHTKNGQLLNTNADTIASEIAIAFSEIYETELYYCFEQKGVLLDVNNKESVIKNINKSNYQTLLANKIITNGMLPKINNSFYALNNKVAKVCIGATSMLLNKNEIHTIIKNE